MLWTASGINGYAIVATDGQFGSVSDFLFDDNSWQIRWLVVDTGNWLPGRKVLLPPSVLGHPDPAKRMFSVDLTMRQVKDSPDIASDRPLSRRDETEIYDYYGWRPYWGIGALMGVDRVRSESSTTGGEERGIANSRLPDGDPHLRSVEAVTGYRIHATDGDIGHIQGFLLEDADWSIGYLVVDTMNWWPGKQVLISPGSAASIDWTGRLVELTVDRQTVKGSPEYDANTTIDRAYEQRFHNHYDDIRAPGQA